MIRLNKALADAGVCSRRKADELISSGVVCVNEEVVIALGTKVDTTKDIITVAGKALTQPTSKDEKRYILLHKPIEVVSTASDPEGRPTVLDCLNEQEKDMRLYPVGRLDYFSEGLLLLTNDGELTHRLTHPSYELPKTYEVLVREKVTQQMLAIMQKGMVLAEGEHLAPVEAHVIVEPDNTRKHNRSIAHNPTHNATTLPPTSRNASTTSIHNSPTTYSASTPSINASAPHTVSSLTISNNQNNPTTLVLVLRQGLNRQVRRMCRDLHLTVLQLKRVGLGPLRLGTLKNGEYRHLSKKEVLDLYKAVNLKK